MFSALAKKGHLVYENEAFLYHLHNVNFRNVSEIPKFCVALKKKKKGRIFLYLSFQNLVKIYTQRIKIYNNIILHLRKLNIHSNHGIKVFRIFIYNRYSLTYTHAHTQNLYVLT